MKFIGSHVDTSPSVDIAPAKAHALGANAFAFNLIAPNRFNAPPYSEAEIEAFRSACDKLGFTAAQILPHSAFVVNLCSPDARKLALSRRTFIDELKRCRQLGLEMLNFHPGAHLKQITDEESLAVVAESINFCLARTDGVTAVIENTAGQGSNIGFTLEQIAGIIAGVDDKKRVGVCIDSCHATAAGYDLATYEGYDKFWADFDRIIGYNYLRGMHLNDAQKPVGSRIDRHASLGDGTVGRGFFERLMADPRIDGIPFILETPDPSRWTAEIEWLRNLAEKH